MIVERRPRRQGIRDESPRILDRMGDLEGCRGEEEAGDLARRSDGVLVLGVGGFGEG